MPHNSEGANAALASFILVDVNKCLLETPLLMSTDAPFQLGLIERLLREQRQPLGRSTRDSNLDATRHLCELQ